MPELPELETLKRFLEPRLIGSHVTSVKVHRRDVINRGIARRRRISHSELLEGARIARILRHGKNLAIVAEDGRCLAVHLGMSGQLRLMRSKAEVESLDHVHCVFTTRARHGPALMVYRDPRRFGGLWSFPSLEALVEQKWSRLGPDALHIQARELERRLCQTERGIKAALLDQALIAGIGNIYADECLFASRIHPQSISSALPSAVVRALAKAIRGTLRLAINAGGSSIRTFLNVNGSPGQFARFHQVYGKAGRSCPRCGDALIRIEIAQRTTTACDACQHLYL